jgi:hypothetical protein
MTDVPIVGRHPSGFSRYYAADIPHKNALRSITGMCLNHPTDCIIHYIFFPGVLSREIKIK